MGGGVLGRGDGALRKRGNCIAAGGGTKGGSGHISLLMRVEPDLADVLKRRERETRSQVSRISTVQ